MKNGQFPCFFGADFAMVASVLQFFWGGELWNCGVFLAAEVS